MKIKFGAFITEGRGKAGGTVFSKNKGGSYAKNKVTPANPQTAAQTDQRNKLALQSSTWRQLLESQRIAWNDAAPNFPVVNVFGDTVFLSGISLRNQLNLNLLKVGATEIMTPPSPAGVVAAIIANASLVLSPAPAFEIEYTTALDSDMSVLVSATTSFSAGIFNFKSRLRNLIVDDTAGSTSVSFLTEYLAQFGNPSPGAKIGLSIVTVNNVTGESSPPQLTSVIVP